MTRTPSPQDAKAGQRTIYGGIWSSASAEAYNRLSDKIAAYEAQGRTPPEHLLNGRHNLYCAQI